MTSELQRRGEHDREKNTSSSLANFMRNHDIRAWNVLTYVMNMFFHEEACLTRTNVSQGHRGD